MSLPVFHLTRAREHALPILDGRTHGSRERGFGDHPASPAELGLGPVLGHFHAPVHDVEDLTPDDALWQAVVEKSATVLAKIGRVNDEMGRLCDLLESCASVAELAANS